MTFNWDTKTRFHIYSLTIADQANIQINSLDVLYQNNNSFIENYLKAETDKQVAEINKLDISKIPEDELKELLQSISDYYGLSHETQDILSNYMLVATFSFYEKSFKKLLDLTGKLNDTELSSCYRKKEAKKLLKNKFNIDYELLTDYPKIEELRCLNNDIKHNGLVGNELATVNPKWFLDKPITNTYDDFKRLMDGPRNLLRDLANKIEPQL
ncbi:MAG: hypothetical protein NTY96_00770 [Bacteroidetes bacterium]|nr:hypothetical protein [Bacteroidota bacterium]